MAERYDAIVIGTGQAAPALCAAGPRGPEDRAGQTQADRRHLRQCRMHPDQDDGGERAREAGETQGFMKVLVDAESKQLLGASLLGMNADAVVHSLLDVMYAKQPYTTIQRAVHIHPTVTELIPTLLGNLKPLAQA